MQRTMENEMETVFTPIPEQQPRLLHIKGGWLCVTEDRKATHWCFAHVFSTTTDPLDGNVTNRV